MTLSSHRLWAGAVLLIAAAALAATDAPSGVAFTVAALGTLLILVSFDTKKD